MTLPDRSTPARQHHTQQVHYLRKTITYLDDGATVDVGTIPKGALVLKPLSGVHVVTAFNGATTNTVNIGPSTDTDLWATALALGATNFVPCDEVVGGFRVDADTKVQADVVSTENANAGEGEIVVAYIPDNDR